METENAACGVCSILYGSDNYNPQVLVNCDHTLCSSCLKKILRNPSFRKCPFDNSAFKRSQRCLDNFPVNFALLALLEGKNRNTRKIHYGERLIMFCLQDKVRICTPCVLFGEHKSHSMKMIHDLKAQGAKIRKDLEKRLMEFEKNQLEKYIEVDLFKKEFLSKMGDRFEGIKASRKAKELEWTKEIDKLFGKMSRMIIDYY